MTSPSTSRSGHHASVRQAASVRRSEPDMAARRSARVLAPSSSALAVRASTRQPASLRVSVATRESEQQVLQPDAKAAKAAAVTERKTVADFTEHTVPLATLASQYSTSVDLDRPERSAGLTPEKAASLLKEMGPNQLSPPKRRHPALIFLHMLLDPFNVMLIVAAALSLISQSFGGSDLTPTYLGCVLIVVVFLNAGIDFVQSQKSASVLRGFANLLPQSTQVVRGGVAQPISALDLVPGDLVVIKSGDKIPADLRLISCVAMKVDNSSLTGESEPQTRLPDTRATNPLEADNLAFFGTVVVNGQGHGIVIRTADRTFMGQIAGMAGAGAKKVSPLTQEISSFVKLIAVVAGVTAIVFFIAGMCIKPDFATNLNYLIGIFVAFVPQGLPATVTMLLTYAAQSLAKSNVLVKDLHAVDTLGTITLLASDKTGTLTQNRMSVVDMWTWSGWLWSPFTQRTDKGSAGEEFAAQGARADPRSGSQQLLDCFALCSTAAFEKTEGNMDKAIADRKILGDATESGILRFASEFVDVDQYRETHTKVFEVPFNSDKKWALNVCHLEHAKGPLTLFIKGAPERVVRMCSTYLVDGVQEAQEAGDETGAFYQRFMEAYEKMAEKGERVLACAALQLPGDRFPLDYNFIREPENFPTSGFCFQGLVGLQDPPKPGVKEAIASCNGAGIQVMMVTGDHPITAEAIARQVGIIKGMTRQQAADAMDLWVEDVQECDFQAVVVHGDEMPHLSQDDWEVILRKKEVVFSRTSPKQKLEIVTRCQAAGHVVGVTGDGVNDSPALRRADMGISMAITGSDVSREAASIILLDDNFASVVEGIKQGRLIFRNLKKSIMYTLTHSTPEVLPFLFYIAIGLPLGLSSFLILFVDLGTEIPVALSFAFEKEEDDIMLVPPRRHVSPREVVALSSEKKDLEAVKSFRVEQVDLAAPENEEKARTLRQRLGLRKRSGGITGGRRSWASRFNLLHKAHPEDEVLVDKNLLIYSYLYMGILETGICLLAYFLVFMYYHIPASELVGVARNHFLADQKKTLVVNGRSFSPDKQGEILAVVQSAWYITLVITQFFNAHLLKVLGRLPCSIAAYRNRLTYYGMCLSIGIAFLVTWTPGITTILQSHPFPMWVVLVGIGGGIAMLLIDGGKRIWDKSRAGHGKATREEELSGSKPGVIELDDVKPRGRPEQAVLGDNAV